MLNEINGENFGLRSPNGWENACVVPVLRCARSHFEHSILSDHLQLQYALPSRESQLTLFRSAESKYTEGLPSSGTFRIVKPYLQQTQVGGT